MRNPNLYATLALVAMVLAVLQTARIMWILIEGSHLSVFTPVSAVLLVLAASGFIVAARENDR